MDTRIGIIGISEPKYKRENSASLDELVHDAARRALEDAGLDRPAIDNVTVCASDLEDGRAISSMVAACPAGAYRRDFIKTTDTGVHALGLATMRMETGLLDATLVLSWSKQSETEEGPIRRLEADPLYRRGTGLGHLTGHATNAAAYLESAPDAEPAANSVVERNTANAADNESGLREEAVPSAAAGDSAYAAYPIREGHLPDPCDGACAMVVCNESTSEDAPTDPVWIEGVGWEVSGYDAATAPLGELSALSGAADSAYQEAGVSDPADALDAAEIHAKSAYHELMAIEALGLTADGGAPAAELEGTFGDDGNVSVNPSGGPYAGNPLIATGLARVAAAADRIRSADSPVDRAVAHSTAGITDQSHGVVVLGGETA